VEEDSDKYLLMEGSVGSEEAVAEIEGAEVSDRDHRVVAQAEVLLSTAAVEGLKDLAEEDREDIKFFS
jgi:hypothetical protein